jgi:hypothetical protein
MQMELASLTLGRIISGLILKGATEDVSYVLYVNS